MDILKPVTSAVRSCSNNCSMVLAYLLVFLMLPVDSMLNVNVQGQVKSVLSQLLVNDLGRVVAAVLFYVIWTTKDVMFLLLYLCLLKKIGLY
tara:strand:+ start:699 stop:974 length:276 start_codon:yes stop_codon:yes gene_type:complete